ncbi:MAG: hypothetical protein GX640_22690 [Fibrobacter sp.]|nr:hypothetical protein [Fibrobacter sp.]
MKQYIFSAFFLVLLFCTASIKTVNETPDLSHTNNSNHLQDTARPVQNEIQPPLNLSVSDWVGHTFIVLKKQSPFNQYGYELYTCKDLDSCKNEVDTSYEHPTHRIRCDKLNGHILQVITSEPLGTEYLLTFKDLQTGLMIYGKTHKQCIKEIVFTGDTTYARMRWLNKSVFSRKGVISTVQNGQNGFGSLKVNIQDSLKVVDIAVGTTPLPVNPIWLVVQVKDSRQGFIPVRASWTNTMSDKIKSTEAWTDDIMESDPTSVYSWDSTIWELINNHRIVKDMTKEQILLSWGEPLNRLQKQYNGVQAECWEYGGQNLFFSEEKLLGIENK